MTGTDVARFTHKQSRSYLNHLVHIYIYIYIYIVCAICEHVSGKGPSRLSRFSVSVPSSVLSLKIIFFINIHKL